MNRVHIPREPESHRALREIADLEGQSVSELMREIVREYLTERHQRDRLENELRAIEELGRIRARVQERHGIIQADLLSEARAERDADTERIWRQE